MQTNFSGMISITKSTRGSCMKLFFFLIEIIIHKYTFEWIEQRTVLNPHFSTSGHSTSGTTKVLTTKDQVCLDFIYEFPPHTRMSQWPFTLKSVLKRSRGLSDTLYTYIHTDIGNLVTYNVWTIAKKKGCCTKNLISLISFKNFGYMIYFK